MKRVLFLIAAAVTVAVTATPAHAAFLFTITYTGPTNAVDSLTNGQVLFTSSSTSQALTDVIAGDAVNLRIAYTATVNDATPSLNVVSYEATYNSSTGANLSPIQYRIDVTTNSAVIPGVAGQALLLNGGFTVNGGNNSTITPSAFVSQTGQLPNPATLAPTPATIPLTNVAQTISGSLPFTRGTGSTGTLGFSATFNEVQNENVNVNNAFANITTPGVAAVPAPATALMVALAAPVLGVVRRLRRTTTTA